MEHAKLICGIIGADEPVMDAAIARLRESFGPTDLESGTIPFDYTDYYREEMGGGLLRRFVAFRDFFDPGWLASVKRETGGIERDLAVERGGRTRRRVNLDPGYVTPSKLVLATTKDFSHRICLGDGVYAEVTLNFRKGACRFFEWTYPDFRSGAYSAFLLAVRERVLEE